MGSRSPGKSLLQIAELGWAWKGRGLAAGVWVNSCSPVSTVSLRFLGETMKSGQKVRNSEYKPGQDHDPQPGVGKVVVGVDGVLIYHSPKA